MEQRAAFDGFCPTPCPPAVLTGTLFLRSLSFSIFEVNWFTVFKSHFTRALVFDTYTVFTALNEPDFWLHHY